MVDIFYKESVTGLQRETELEDLRNEILMDNLIIEYTSVKNDYEIFLSEAAIKVYSENGTKDDLISLYTEAEEQTKEKKKGIFRRIFDVILNILGGIKKFFQSLFTKDIEKEIPNGVDLPQNDVDNIEKSCGILEKIKNILKKLGSNIIGGLSDIGTFLKEHPTYTIGGAIGAVSGTAVVIHHFKPDFLKNLFRKSEKATSDVEEATKEQSQNEALLNSFSGAVVNSVAQATANSDSTLGQVVHAGAQAAADTANKEGLFTKFLNWIRNCCSKFGAFIKRMKEKIFGSKAKGTPNDQNTDNRTSEQVQQDVGKAVADTVKKRNEKKEAAKAKDEGVVYAGTNPSDNSDEPKDISSNLTDEQIQQNVGKAVADAVKKRNDEKEAAKAKTEDQKKKDEGVVYAGTNPSDNSDEPKDISSNLTDEERKKKEEEKAKEQREVIWAGTPAKPKKSRKSYGMLSDSEIDEYDRLEAKKHARSITKEERKRFEELKTKKKQKAVQI